MVNTCKYANPETVLGFAYRINNQSARAVFAGMLYVEIYQRKTRN